MRSVRKLRYYQLYIAHTPQYNKLTLFSYEVSKIFRKTRARIPVDTIRGEPLRDDV